MPLFLDVHSLDDPVTLSDVTRAHDADLRPTYAATRYWVDEQRDRRRRPQRRRGTGHGLVARRSTTRPIPRHEHAGVRAARGVGRHRGRLCRARRAGRAVDLGRGARLVGLSADETFLDVAAGPGGLGLAAARLGATVLATDWAPPMVAQFEARVRSRGLDQRIAARVMDAHALDLEDDSFDVTGSQFGVMLVPDQAVALREMVRVTKPGGRVLLVAYGSPDGVRRAAVLHRRPADRGTRLRGAAGPAAAGVPGLRSRRAARASRCRGAERRAGGHHAAGTTRAVHGSGGLGLDGVQQPDHRR